MMWFHGDGDVDGDGDGDVIGQRSLGLFLCRGLQASPAAQGKDTLWLYTYKRMIQ